MYDFGVSSLTLSHFSLLQTAARFGALAFTFKPSRWNPDPSERYVHAVNRSLFIRRTLHACSCPNGRVHWKGEFSHYLETAVALEALRSRALEPCVILVFSIGGSDTLTVSRPGGGLFLRFGRKRHL